MEEIYSIPLALEDFLPVIFSGIGFFLIAKMIHKMDKGLSIMAYIGVALLISGGLSKATWKLIYAMSDAQMNIQLMDNALFFGLSTGFILMAYALWYAQRGYVEKKRPGNVWFFPLAVCAITVGTALYMMTTQNGADGEESRVWFYILLGMTTIFNVVTVGLAIRQAYRQKQMLAVALFSINIITVFVMQGLARTGDRTETSQWVAQITNTISQLVLVYGAWLIYRYVCDTDNEPVVEVRASNPDLKTA